MRDIYLPSFRHRRSSTSSVATEPSAGSSADSSTECFEYLPAQLGVSRMAVKRAEPLLASSGWQILQYQGPCGQSGVRAPILSKGVGDVLPESAVTGVVAGVGACCKSRESSYVILRTSVAATRPEFCELDASSVSSKAPWIVFMRHTGHCQSGCFSMKL